MSLALVGAAVLTPSIIAYIMSPSTGSDEDLCDPEGFQKRKELYRERRDAFRCDPKATEELREWKAKNDDYDYVKLGSGLIPSKFVGKIVGSKAFGRSDTWFSEFASHNPSSLILSESRSSYIIGNHASYDMRQYPHWLNPIFNPGENTPEGQGFGHCLVIHQRRVFNIVDPEATADNSALLKEMKEHFITFWETGGSPKLLERVKSAFDDQNTKLKSDGKNAESYSSLLPTLKKDFEALSMSFLRCNPEDFEFAFHAYPDNSVGHLHMHVFPKQGFLRQFSTKSHDWKTIPIEAVLEVEEEDKNRVLEPASG